MMYVNNRKRKWRLTARKIMKMIYFWEHLLVGRKRFRFNDNQINNEQNLNSRFSRTETQMKIWKRSFLNNITSVNVEIHHQASLSVLWWRSLVQPLTPDRDKVKASIPLTSGQKVSLYFWMAATDCVCTLISRLQARQIYRTIVGPWGCTPLACSFPLCRYTRVRSSGILIPVPLHFAITIPRYSPRLRMAPDLCCLAIYISSKCFSISTTEGLIATQMDIWTFPFGATPVFWCFFHSSRSA